MNMNFKTHLIFLILLAVAVSGNNRPPGFSTVVKQVIRNNTSSATNQSSTNLNSIDRVRIIGGVETTRNEFPFIVSFARYGRHFCGGAIIDPEFILTAAHCASEPDFTVTAGEHDLYAKEGTEQVSQAIQVIRHPKYDPVTYEDDICLVKVSPPFKYNDFVKPFSVPSTHYIANGEATVAGWGTEDEAYQVVSPVLRKVTVPLVRSIDCSSQYGQYFLPLKMICAGEEEGGKDACQGDSGGPLMCDDYHKGATLCGIVSFGLGCARRELAGVYTKVAYYSDWVDYEKRRNTNTRNNQPRTTKKPTPNNPFPHWPPTTTAAPSVVYPTIPPGYVVIYKPVNQSYVPPADAHPSTVYPHRHRHRSGGNVIQTSSLTLGVSLILLLVTCYI